MPPPSARSSTIEVRRPTFDLTSDVPRYWNGGDAFATHYLNALSSAFPDGEAFFVRSVQHFRDRVQEPELLNAIRGFSGQEAQHSRQHDRHLTLLVERGYPALIRMNRVVDRSMRFGNRHWPVVSLASTAAVEHLTALLARRILAPGSRFTAAMDPRMAALWRWHAVEEAEHKAVAYDVLQRVSQSLMLRSIALVANSIALFFEVLARALYMLWKDGVLFRLETLSSGGRFLFGRGGLLRGHARGYFSWFRRDFHPSHTDDLPLIEAWRAHG